ncbi:MAG TPA: LysM peptidoglycan-binding domain-containing protein [Ktedonobacterales bacterium]|nr:LysM peptidoglycan-binding domain-containing protein [Ktedonobacterales bacterium]
MAGFFSNAAEEAKKIPWWGWVLGGGAVLLFGSHLLSQNTNTGTASADAAGVDMSGGSIGDIGTAGPPAPTGTTGTTSTTSTTSTSSPPPATKAPPAPTPTATKTYTVRSGDTLNLIASRYHVDEPALYSINAGTIEATAKAHGFGSSDHGHWIFPGEVLKIPA